MVAGHQPWQVLSALPAWQLTQVTRAPGRGDNGHPDHSSRDDGAARRGPGLGSAAGRAAPGPGAGRPEPADDGTLEEMTSQVALAQLEAQRSDSPRAKLAERRAAARHAELRQAASTGLWRVHLLAGASTPSQAAQVAGLLRASTDLAGLPYALLPARPAVAPPERNHERPA